MTLCAKFINKINKVMSLTYLYQSDLVMWQAAIDVKLCIRLTILCQYRM